MGSTLATNGTVSVLALSSRRYTPRLTLLARTVRTKSRTEVACRDRGKRESGGPAEGIRESAISRLMTFHRIRPSDSAALSALYFSFSFSFSFPPPPAPAIMALPLNARIRLLNSFLYDLNTCIKLMFTALIMDLR